MGSASAAREKNLARHQLSGFNGFNVRAWTPKEDRLVRTLPTAEVVKRTGRTLAAVYDQCSLIGVPDGRWPGPQRLGRCSGPAGGADEIPHATRRTTGGDPY
jgi:hypothetical protein